MSGDINNLLGKLKEIEETVRFIEEQSHGSDEDFKKWETQRQESLRMVDLAEEELDDVFVKASWGRGIGSTLSVVGSALKIASFFTKNGEGMRTFGTGLDVVGCATVPVTTLIGMGFSKKIIADLERALKKDTELSKKFEKQLTYTKELGKLLKEVFGVFSSVNYEKILKVVQIFLDVAGKIKTGYIAVEQQISALKKALQLEVGPDQINGIVDCMRRFMTTLKEAGAEKLNSVCNLLESFRKLFNPGLIFYLEFLSCSLQTIFAGMAMANINVLGNILEPYWCHLQAINLALHGFSLWFSIEGIKHGKSAYTTSLNELRYRLKEELVHMQKMHSKKED